MLDASKVVISSETREQLARPMSRKKRSELRQELIKSYVKSKPAGTRIQFDEFARVGSFTRQEARRFVLTLVKKEIIRQEKIGPRAYAYFVPRAPRDPSEPVTVRAKTPRLTAEEIEQLAMRFSWQHPEDQNDLRKFIVWLQRVSDPTIKDSEVEQLS